MGRIAAVASVLLGLLGTLLFAGTLEVRTDYLELGDQVIQVRSRTPISCSRFSLDHDYVMMFAFSGDSSSLAYFSIDDQGVYLKRVLLKPLSVTTIHQWAPGEAMPAGKIVWAPRGDVFVFQAQVGEEGATVIQTWLAAAPWKELQPLDLKGDWDETSLVWSPNGQMIAYRIVRTGRDLLEPIPGGPPPPPEGIWVYDLRARQSFLVSPEIQMERIVGWANDRTITFHRNVLDPATKQIRGDLVQIALDPGQPPVVTPYRAADAAPDEFSADRKWWVSTSSATAANQSPPGDVKIERQGGEPFDVTKNKRSRFLAWSPTDRCLAYLTSEAAKDDTGKIARTSSDLWLAAVPDAAVQSAAAPTKHRQLLVAQGLDPSGGQAYWSSDGRKLAYSSDGILWVAVLEKLSADQAQGVRRSYEGMVRTRAVSNARQIALALIMYTSDFDDQLPPAEDIEKTLAPYARDASIFYSVEDGTTPVFTYLPPADLKLADVADPANTVIGFIDCGYGWRAELYADGHAAVKQ